VSTTTHETYLGDGLYARHDGSQIILRAPREGGDHWVGLEPEVFAALLAFHQRVLEDRLREGKYP
jgi:hypothetical protein